MLTLRVERNTEKNQMTEYNQRDEYFKMLQDFVTKAANETGHFHRMKALENVANMLDACEKLEINRMTKLMDNRLLNQLQRGENQMSHFYPQIPNSARKTELAS